MSVSVPAYPPCRYMMFWGGGGGEMWEWGGGGGGGECTCSWLYKGLVDHVGIRIIGVLGNTRIVHGDF